MESLLLVVFRKRLEGHDRNGTGTADAAMRYSHR